MVNVELLKNEMKELGTTQTILAEKCGVTRQTIANWLDDPDLISVNNARIIADALRITDKEKIFAIFLPLMLNILQHRGRFV